MLELYDCLTIFPPVKITKNCAYDLYSTKICRIIEFVILLCLYYMNYDYTIGTYRVIIQ